MRSLYPRLRDGAARLLADTRAAIGIPGALVATVMVGATVLPVANVTLKAEQRRIEDAAAAGALAATRMMRAEGGTATQAALRAEAERYARMNLLDLPPAARRKANESLVVTLTADRSAQTVDVGVEAKLPGTALIAALDLAPGGGGGSTALPETTRGGSQVECHSDRVQLVLALDMTRSMGARFSEGGGSRQIDVATDVAADLVESVQRLCSQLELEVGLVPWATSVRVPDGQADRWRRHGWIDRSRFAQRGVDESIPAQRWAGCLEDRLMDTSTTRAHSMGLLLTTAEDRHFPPYIYPDTARHSHMPRWVAAQADWLHRLRTVNGLSGLPASDSASLAAVIHGDNDWARGGSPNRGCTGVGMIPPRELAPGDEWLDQALAEIRGVELTDYGTMAHLGVTWARRMLHPAWDAIWDPNGDPDDAVDGSQLQKDPDVTQVLVLLSDGGNSMQAVDPWDRVPGRASVHLGIDIGPGGTEVKKLKMRRSFTSGVTLGSLTLERNTVVGYGALGRNGPGTAADGHRSDVRHITSQESGQAEHAIPDLARKGRRFLDEILTASCGEARKEGIEIYTVSLSSAHGGADARHQDQILQACAGTQLAPGDSGYAFRAQDEDGIRAAFRDIGQRVVRIRRAS